MASVSVSGQNKDKNDLLVIKQIGKFWVSLYRGGRFILTSIWGKDEDLPKF